ncbi:MAG: diguanylate cyclase [Proteobacteria bacterium]|nr:diguanylate cyclase [Pseudomonadota bacterium]
MKPNILIVDDDKLFLEQCVDMLIDVEGDLHLATSCKEASDIIESNKIDILILDLVLPDGKGDSVMEIAKKKNPDVDVIIISAFGTVESVINLMRKGIFDYIKKPIVPEEFKFTILKCLRERAIIEENRKLKESLNIYELGKMLTSNLELPKVYDNILVLFDNIMKGSKVVVFSSDVSDNYDIRAFLNFDRSELANIKEKLVDFLNDRVCYKTDETIDGNISIFKLSNLDFPEKFDKNYLITFPIIFDNRVKGGVFVFADYIQDSKREFFTFIRDHINLAIENAIRYINAQEMAFIDELTKVYNIRYLHVALENEIKRAERFGSFLSVLFLDLDFFKNINDTYGHLTGSKLLIEIAKEIKRCVRSIDIVIRYGGDEFVIICTETDPELALKVAERIRKRIETTEFLKEEGKNIKITASIGIATYPVNATTKTDLLELADKAMYKGKETTRNVVYLTDKVLKR